MSATPEKFGEAFVELRMQLDEFERDLNAAEQRTSDAIERVEVRARGLSDTFANVGQGMGGFAQAANETGELAVTAAKVGIMIWGWRAALRVVSRLISAIGASAGLMAGTIALAVVHTGHFIRGVRSAADGLRDMVTRLREMTLREIFEEALFGLDRFIDRIPVVSHLWDAAKVTISEVSELLGGPNFVRRIEEHRAAIAQAKAEWEAYHQAVQRIHSGQTFAQVPEDEERRRRLNAAATPADRARLQGEFREADLHDRLLPELRRVRAEYDRIIAEMTEAGASEGELRQVALRAMRVEMTLERQRAEAIKEIRRSTAQEVADLEEESAMAHAMQMADLQGRIHQVRARRELEGFALQADTIRREFERNVLQAEMDNDEARKSLERALHDEQMAEAREREIERAGAMVDGVQQGLARAQQRLAREALRGDGPQLKLRLFDIDADTQRQFDQIDERVKQLTASMQAAQEAGEHALSEQISDEITRLQKLRDEWDAVGEARRQAARDDEQERLDQRIRELDERNRLMDDEINLGQRQARWLATERRLRREIDEARIAGNEREAEALQRQLQLKRQIHEQDEGLNVRQIDMAELMRRPALPGQGEGGAGEERNRTRLADLQLQELRAVREAIERGVPAILN